MIFYRYVRKWDGENKDFGTKKWALLCYSIHAPWINRSTMNDWSILKSAWPLFDHILDLPPAPLGVRNNHTCVRIWELKDRWSCQLKHFHQHFGVTYIFYPAYSRSYSFRFSTSWWWFPKIRLHFTCMQSPLAVPKKDANAAQIAILDDTCHTAKDPYTLYLFAYLARYL